MLTQARLRELLDYDPETGEFRWRVNRGGTARKGCLAGTINSVGYRVVEISHKAHTAHRLAWLYVHGVFPRGDLDHINRVRTDNRLANLRLATRSMNMLNSGMRADNLTGHTGVHRSFRIRLPWKAMFRNKHLGNFATKEEAARAYQEARSAHGS